MSVITRSAALRLFVRARAFSTAPPPRLRRLGRVLVLSSALTTSVLGYAFYTDASNIEPPSFDTRTLSDLVRAYIVYGTCSIAPLVDAAPTILDILFGTPGVSKIAENFVRATFFHQFVGADTANGALPLLASLRAENKGALFSYAVEVDEKEVAGQTNMERQPAHKRIIEEIIRTINASADFEDGRDARQNGHIGRRTWVSVKLTAMLPNAQSLINLSTHLTNTRAPLEPPVLFPGTPSPSDLSILHSSTSTGALTESDIHDLKELYNDLVQICTRAEERGVRVFIDAEHSWYQPAIDAFGHALMEQFNKLPSNGFRRTWREISSWTSSPSAREPVHDKVRPLVYVTYQAYLRRTPMHLAHSLALARARGYALGVKLVRGAYHPYELAVHQLARSADSAVGPYSSNHSRSLSISPDPEPPVQPSKDATDQCYYDCVTMLIDAISQDVPRSGRFGAPGIGVFFGTHNWTSCEFILEELVKKGLGVVERVGIDEVQEDVVQIPLEVGERIAFGQLYGMSDTLTNYLVGRTRCESPCVIKYVPFGTLLQVMPYLSRRAIENKSVLGAGGATRERKEAAALIWKKMKGLVVS
ncbi:FAD-linked oxidoreductase-like protein [Suillus subalutaceus]|uniref:FAD-linked oxidoreductase-like protein n=1 Tax=Suillus subalutaceus TaxID=48586 RepID=UPI001B88085F|nr:FAD-linked oxidoreductase-like protein [Suillus subalutaceus]KAG1839647.1 FAD-linked oxidoreductase-like protein [Suillus subalutaceus]